MEIYLSNLDKALILSTVIAIALGILIFFLAGLYRVPKGRVIIIEKARQFYCTYDKGIHYHNPLIYQRVGSYVIKPVVRRYTAQNGNELDITYKIEDVKKFHYSGMTFKAIMMRIEKENSEITLSVLTDSFAKFGLHFISINKAK